MYEERWLAFEGDDAVREVVVTYDWDDGVPIVRAVRDENGDPFKLRLCDEWDFVEHVQQAARDERIDQAVNAERERE